MEDITVEKKEATPKQILAEEIFTKTMRELENGAVEVCTGRGAAVGLCGGPVLLKGGGPWTDGAITANW